MRDATSRSGTAQGPVTRAFVNVSGAEFHVRTEPSLEGKKVPVSRWTQWFPGRLSVR